MNKDNLLFAVIGILFGFISGYLLHEVMAARQPPRRLAGDASALASGGAGETAQEGQGGAPAGGGDGAAFGAGPAEGGAGAPSQAAGPAAGGAPGAPPMKAIQELRDRVAQHPEDADAVLKLANASYDVQMWDRARDLYLRYLKLRPSSPGTLTDLGVTYRFLKDYDKALSSFHRAQQLQPDHWQSRFDEVMVLGFDLQRYAEAKAVLVELKKLRPGDREVEALAAEIEKRAAGGQGSAQPS